MLQSGQALRCATIRVAVAFLLALAGSSAFANACNINSVSDLQAMSTSGSYTLCQDFDASSVNFVPIGTYSNPFMGTLDGNGFTIKNLTIISAGADGFQGLFGSIGPGGSVHNLGLSNALVTNVTGAHTGVLAGANFGSIDQVSASGKISVTSNGRQAV
jgi:hypothetical protein